METLTFEPLVAMQLWLALAILGLLALGVYGVAMVRRVSWQRAGAVLVAMTLCLAMPLVLLLNPVWHENLPPPEGKPVLTLLVDGSASMATRDAGSGSRYEAASAYARRIAAGLGPRYEIRVERFTDHVLPLDLAELPKHAPQTPRTDLAAAMTENATLDRVQGHATVLISDGIPTAGGGTSAVLMAARRSGAMSAPVFTHSVGGPAEAQDIAVSLRTPQELAFVGQKLPVDVVFRQHAFGRREIGVRLVLDGQPVDSERVMLEAGAETSASFIVSQPKPGLYQYRVEADSLAGEVTDANNHATLLLRVVDKPVRVLLLEGKPYWDTRFLMRTLAADASLELTSVVQMAPGRLLQQTIASGAADKEEKKPPAADQPVTRQQKWAIRRNTGEVLQKLDDYQIVVLGRDTELLLNDAAIARLRAWIAQSSGSLVCFRGSPATRVPPGLTSLLPVHWLPGRESRFHLQLTARGEQLHWIAGQRPADDLATLPTLARTLAAERPKPWAVVLAETADAKSGSTEPVISYQSFGSGRSVVIEGAGMWRWGFLPPGHPGHKEVYATLWRNLTRWLVANIGLLPGEDAWLRTDKVQFGPEEPASATLLVREGFARPEQLQVVLSGTGVTGRKTFPAVPSGDDPGTFRVVFGKLQPGKYEARLNSPALGRSKRVSGATSFEVRADLDEQLDLRARPELLARVAQESGGAELNDPTGADLAGLLDRHLERVRPQRVARSTAWDRWWVLLGIGGLWGSCWGLRRTSGLV